MNINKPKNLKYPLIALAAASALLIIILGVITYLNYNHDKELLRNQLLQEGLTLIRSTEAGARTGMMEMMWGENQIQTLISETAKGPNIISINLTDKNGRVLASSDSGSIGQIENNFEKPKNKNEFVSKIIEDYKGREVFQLVKQFEPVSVEYNHEIQGMMNRMMGGYRNNSSVEKMQFIILDLNMEGYKSAQAEDIRRAIISAIILLVLGSASFYFLFILQSYYVTDNALKNMETYAKNVVESIPNGLFSLNKEGRIETVNRYAAELLKLNHSELIGKSLTDVLPACDFNKILPSDKTVVERQMNCSLNDNSMVPLSVTSSSLFNQNGDNIGTVIIFRDMREIRSLEQKVERSERLASLGRMATGIAHEIRNPLSSIKGFAQYFKNKFKSDSEEWNYAGVMVNEVDRLNRVIQDLLNFAKPQEPNFSSHNITDLIDHSLKLIQPEIKEKKIEVVKNYDDNIPLVNVDSDMITQALLNLFLNAAEAMKHGGILKITVSLADQIADENSEILKESKNIKLEITDNGTGIPEENLSHIFDPFFTSKKGGTGLGLAIVYRIIENHNGKIEAVSEPGKGTAFKILFPVVD
ncbi:MAG: ATP-binding protein [Ignavibacteriaceae bacterium]